MPRTQRPLDDVRERFDPGDKWGSTMGERFGIAAALWYAGEYVPAEWEYQHGLGIVTDEDEHEEPDASWLDALRSGTYSPAELVHAGNVLARYADNLRRLGHDY